MSLLIDGRTALFGGLVDYAGIFPPASLSLEQAVAEYREARQGGHAWMLGRFLVTTSRLEELAGLLTRSMITGEAPWPVGAIVDEAPGVGALHAQVFERHMSPATRVETIEVRLPAAASDGRPVEEAVTAVKPIAEAVITVSADVVPYLEVARTDGWEAGIPNAVEGIAYLRRQTLRRLGAKLRTGGTEADAFPSPEQVARFIVSCNRADVAFKATAGLHHPLRHHDAELGVMRHGFLNVLIAAAIARAGGDEQDVCAVLTTTEPDAFTVTAGGVRYFDHRIGIRDVRDMRRALFHAYGSCSFDEPVDDLTAMGVLG